MKKILHLIILIFALQIGANAQVDSANLQLRGLFGNLAKPVPPKQFNWDMAVHFVDSSLFVEVNNTDTLSIDNWSQMYIEMRNSAYDTTQWVPFDDLDNASNQYFSDTINMYTMYFDYYRFKPNALTTNTYFNFDTINNILTDKIPRPGFPYDEYSVFAASPNKNILYSHNYTFRFGVDNIIYDNFHEMIPTNPNEYLLRANFNDGSGWHDITFGVDNYFNITFPTNGIYPIEVIIEDLRNGNNVITKSISFVEVNAVQPFAGILDNPDQILNIDGMTLNVYKPCNVGGVPENEKTLIYLEGYDPMDFIRNFNRSAQSIYDNQIVASQISDLRNFGYNIIVVDWKNSRIDIEQNADYLINLLEDLKCGQIIGDVATKEQFVIIGESMGGLVANLALLKMEHKNYKARCYAKKEHNVRLLITLDTPFEGAHIPMSIQKTSRLLNNNNISAGSLVSNMLSLSLKKYFKANNLLLDGIAAKQMLMTHASTKSLLGCPTYTHHKERDNFLQLVKKLGGHPKHCKLVAASNGNMLGLGQTRYWDGNTRSHGDALLHAKLLTHGTILGMRFNFFGANMELNSDPNGCGKLGELSAGRWSIKIRLKWFGLRIKTGFNSILYREWEGDMRPVSNSAGGIMSNNTIIRTHLLSSMNYQAAGVWELNNNNKWGSDKRVRTDGFHWNFVPVSSAFNFGPNLVVPYDNMSISSFMNHPLFPFDVAYGVPGNTFNGIFGATDDFWANAYVRNNHHTDVRNDILTDLSQSPVELSYPPYCPVNPANNTRNIRMLNREIGDNELYLENRYLPCLAGFSAPDIIHLNTRSPFYNYPSSSSPNTSLESVYSKENPFLVDPNGLAELFVSIGSHDINPPFLGPIDPQFYGFKPCCEDYLRQASSETILWNMADENEVSIFPNPTGDNHFTLTLDHVEKGTLSVWIYDITGRIIFNTEQNIESDNSKYYLPIHLNKEVSSGQYSIVSKFNKQSFSNRLIIK